MSAWIFQVNPNSFHEGYPGWQNGEDDWWCLSHRSGIEKGHTVFVWQSIDYRSKPPKPRGIYAKGTISAISPFTVINERHIDQLKRNDRSAWVDSEERIKQESKPVTIIIRYEAVYPDRPLTIDQLRDAGLGHLHIARFPHLEKCAVADSDKKKLLTLLAKR